MKNLVLIIHSNLQQDVADQLRGMEQLSEFTFTPVEGHGVQLDDDAELSARDKVVGYTPRVRVDILLNDTDVESVLKVLRGSVTGAHRQGVYWVTDVEQHGQL